VHWCSIGSCVTAPTALFRVTHACMLCHVKNFNAFVSRAAAAAI
jgi:hypothetical protein